MHNSSAQNKSIKELDQRTALWLLTAITLLALFLRLLHVNSDLWLDEIWPVLAYGQLSALEVIASTSALGNHLLNTLLVNLAIAGFGEREWAIRLPAVIFGTATIPAIYWVTRLALSRQASLSVALLLAVFYHHVFFSQNARGYTAYLFFSLLSSGLLVKGLQEDRARIWGLYVVTMFFNLASVMISAFVFASHILVGAVALLTVRRGGASSIPLLRRLAGVFAVTAFLGFCLYAMTLFRVYVAVQTTYTEAASGYSLFSAEALKELVRGISAGFGSGMIFGTLPFLIVGGVGFVVLLRRQWSLTVALVIPQILTVIFLIVSGLNFYPRFFLLALPLSILVVVQGIYSFAKLIERILGKSKYIFSSGLAIMLVLIICAVSLISLRNYYSMPKQAYRASIRYIEAERKPGEIIIVIYLADSGYSYYGKEFKLKQDKDYFLVRSEEDLDAVLSSHLRNNSFVVTTFPHALRLSSPELYARVEKGWKVVRTFSGSIGDGEISVWKQR